MIRILIVEDDIVLSRTVVNWLKASKMSAECVTTVRDGLSHLKTKDYDLILSDLRLPDGSGIKILDWLNEQHKNLPVIIMTKYGDVPTAVDAVKRGAVEFIEKPVYDIPLVETIQKVIEGRTPNSGETKIIKRVSRAYQELVRSAELVADHNISVMIRGESGAGKEHIAHLLHDRSKRRNMPFVKVDCGTITAELAASAFFGHVKGAFTGADTNTTGLFHEADGGTLYFDEIGNLPIEAQRVLLRVLQERRYMPVGGTKEMSCDVRIIAATNEDIEQAVEDKRFRYDLWQRVDEYSLEVPSLGDCPEDVLPLAEELLKRYNAKFQRSIEGFADEARERLQSHSWPGNVRELKNIVRRAVVETTGNVIEADRLKFKPVPRKEDALTLKDDGEEKRKIERALAKANSNLSKAAEILGISRPTLYKKMEMLGLR
ncbi:MAG: rteB, two-component system response regulator [bacterium P3]|nr:MAG: rteB, two-component system response regulator [bacterium P3]